MCRHFCSRVAHAGEEARMNVLPWYRLFGVAKSFSQSQRRKNQAARKGKWSPRGTGMTVLPIPAQASRVSVAVRGAPGKQARLVKTVNIQVLGGSSRQDRQLPGGVTHPRPERASARSWVETRVTWLGGRFRLGHQPVVLFCYLGEDTAQCTVRPA